MYHGYIRGKSGTSTQEFLVLFLQLFCKSKIIPKSKHIWTINKYASSKVANIKQEYHLEAEKNMPCPCPHQSLFMLSCILFSSWHDGQSMHPLTPIYNPLSSWTLSTIIGQHLLDWIGWSGPSHISPSGSDGDIGCPWGSDHSSVISQLRLFC